MAALQFEVLCLVHISSRAVRLADEIEADYVVSCLQSWDDSIPCWQALPVPVFDTLDCELFRRALGVIL